VECAATGWCNGLSPGCPSGFLWELEVGSGELKKPHHHVYVVYLRNPNGDGKAGYYVGMTGLSPEQRFVNHKAGIRSASVVRKYGERLVPVLYEHLNPMAYDVALRMEGELAESLRKRGFVVFGGH
jgi:predicted GIY-YIG superfamily endonuclease